MRGAQTAAAPLARRGARAACVAIFGLLLVAAAMQVASLTHVDPRARGAWRTVPLAFDATPRDVPLFVPACDVPAVRLHPAGPASGRVTVQTFADAGSTLPGGPPVLLAREPDGTYRLALATAPPWRTPIVLRIRAHDAVLTLAPGNPITFDRPTSLLGTLPCAFDGRSGRAWLAVAALAVVVLTAGGLACAWAARALGWEPTRAAASGAGTLLTVAAVGASVVLYQLVVPPFEPPDELAHLQYARYVATTASLPQQVPPPDSEWRASSYEWVQQPLYYLGAAAVLRATALHTPAPHLTLNPRSRLQPGGTEPTIFQHGRPAGDRTGHHALTLLRVLSLLMALATAWLSARLVRTVTDDALVAATVAGGLALIPQWCAVMGAVSTDPPATWLAATATLALLAVTRGGASPQRLLAAGALIGAAYAVKATAAFLVPVALLACLATPPVGADLGTRLRAAAVRLSWIGLGAVLVAGWIPVRAWLLYGDPQAFAFKRAILEAGGFVPTQGPPPWTPEFWAQMRLMVFEPFWARFGSLGAGPLPGSKVWLAYAAASAMLAALACAGSVSEVRRVAHDRRGWLAWMTDGLKSPVALCLIATTAGLVGWLAVNLVPRADMVVHWTPRHILPLTAPAAVLVAAGLHAASRRGVAHSRATAALVAATIVLLAVAYVWVFRATVLTLHFGY